MYYEATERNNPGESGVVFFFDFLVLYSNALIIGQENH